MKPTIDRTAKRRQWYAESLGDDLVDSRAFLPLAPYQQIKLLAETLGERIPLIVGKLAVAQIKLIQAGKIEPLETIESPVVPMTAPDKLEELQTAILASRFPEDNGATRIKQLALLQAISLLTKSGKKPTTASIAKISDNHPSQMLILAKALEERGVIVRVKTASVSPGKSGKVLQIREKALEALNLAHIKQTGSPITNILDDAIQA